MNNIKMALVGLLGLALVGCGTTTISLTKDGVTETVHLKTDGFHSVIVTPEGIHIDPKGINADALSDVIEEE